MRYAKKEAEITDLPLNIVLRSQPVKNYAKKLWLKD